MAIDGSVVGFWVSPGFRRIANKARPCAMRQIRPLMRRRRPFLGSNVRTLDRSPITCWRGAIHSWRHPDITRTHAKYPTPEALNSVLLGANTIKRPSNSRKKMSQQKGHFALKTVDFLRHATRFCAPQLVTGFRRHQNPDTRFGHPGQF